MMHLEQHGDLVRRRNSKLEVGQRFEVVMVRESSNLGLEYEYPPHQAVRQAY